MADSRNKRTHRALLWDAQGGKCFYCDTETVLPYGPKNMRRANMATVEHRHPRSRGGRSVLDNKVMTCVRCNVLKGLMLEPVWMLVREDANLCKRLGVLTHQLHMLGLTEIRDAIRNRS